MTLSLTYFSRLDREIPELRWSPQWVPERWRESLPLMRGLEVRIDGIADSEVAYRMAVSDLEQRLRELGAARRFSALFYVSHVTNADSPLFRYKLAKGLGVTEQDVFPVSLPPGSETVLTVCSDIDESTWSRTFETLANAQSAAIVGALTGKDAKALLLPEIRDLIRAKRAASLDHFSFWPMCARAGLMSGQRYVGQDGESVSFVIVGAAVSVESLAVELGVETVSIEVLRHDQTTSPETTMLPSYNRDEDRLPDTGPICDHCGLHIPELHLTDDTERRVRDLIRQGRRLQAALEIETAIGCPRAWAKVWVQHGGRPQPRLPGTTCPHCGGRLRTSMAKQCLECGADWHDDADAKKPGSD